MKFEDIRDHFYRKMPPDLCAPSVDFFKTVSTKEEMIQHLKSYPHWSIYKNIVSRETVQILGEAFCNARGLFVGQGSELGAVAPSISISGGGGFVFSESRIGLEVYGENDFLYLRDSYISRLFIGGNVKHLHILPDTKINQLVVIGKIQTLRIHDSLIETVIFEDENPGAEVKRLIFGRGGRINKYDRSNFGRIVGD